MGEDKNYVVALEMKLDVRTDNIKEALKIIKSSPPHKSCVGAGIDIWYNIKTRDKVKIISTREKHNKS